MKVVGVDFGGTNIRSAVVDEKGKILGRDERPTFAERSKSQILNDLWLSIVAAANNARIPPADLDAIGVGAPGPLDWRNKRLLNPPNLRKLWDVPIGAAIENRLGIQTEIANDADCFALGEHAFGAAKKFGRYTMCGITIGTGFGSGVVHEGRLFRGMGIAPEVGHTDVWMPAEWQAAGLDACSCGERGHAEAVLSGYGILRLAKYLGLVVASAKELGAMLEAKDRRAQKIVGEVGTCLGRVLVNIVHNFHPRVIVVGGSIAKFGWPMIMKAHETMDVVGFRAMTKDVNVVPAQLGDDAGVLGAAKLAFDSLKGGGA